MAFLTRDGVKLYYETHGEGPVILLTHGYSSTAQMWRGQIAALSAKHKLVTWDMRGHGQSDYPADQSAYSEEATVADMAALLDAVGAKTAIIGGLSLGGYMSLAFHRETSRARGRAAHHRHRSGLQEGRVARRLEQDLAAHRGAL